MWGFQKAIDNEILNLKKNKKTIGLWIKLTDFDFDVVVVENSDKTISDYMMEACMGIWSLLHEVLDGIFINRLILSLIWVINFDTFSMEFAVYSCIAWANSLRKFESSWLSCNNSLSRLVADKLFSKCFLLLSASSGTADPPLHIPWLSRNF